MAATESFRSGFSIHTSRLIDVMNAGKIGDMFTREKLSEIAGVDVSPEQKGYGYVQSAIRYCERQGKVWRWSKADTCYRCLDAKDAANLVCARTASAHRFTGRSLRIASTVNRADIGTLDDQRAFDAAVLQTALARQAMGGAMRKKLESRVDTNKLTAPTPEQLAGILK